MRPRCLPARCTGGLRIGTIDAAGWCFWSDGVAMATRVSWVGVWWGKESDASVYTGRGGGSNPAGRSQPGLLPSDGDRTHMVPPFLERDGPAMCWLAGRGPDQGERVWSAVSESGKPHPNLAPQHQYPNTNTNTNTPNTHKYPTPPLSTRWGGFRVDHTGGTSEHLPSTSRPGGSGKVRAPRGGKEGRRERRNVPPPAICPSVHLSICPSVYLLSGRQIVVACGRAHTS